MTVENTTAQDDVASAIASLSAGGDDSTPDAGTPPGAAPEATGDAPAPRDDQTPATAPDGAPEGGESDDKRGPKRGPDGKFAKRDDVPSAPEDDKDGQQPAPTGDEATPKAPKATDEAPDGLALDPSKPPQGWRPDAKAKWDTIPEDIRQEIIRRESDSAAGVAKLRKQYEPAEQLYNGVAKHAEYFQKIQAHPVQYIDQMVQTEKVLSTGNPAQRMEKLLEVADTYGVPIRQALDSAMGGKLNNFLQQAHQQHKTPPTLPPEIQRELEESRRFREQITNNAAQAELKAFIDTGPEYFEEVKGDMAKLLESGACESYQEAYETAVWRNPEIRQREIERQQGLQQKQVLKQRQQQAASVRPPTGAPLVDGRTTDEPLSTEDAVRAAFAAQQGR